MAVSVGVPTAAQLVGFSHGLGDALCSTGADTGADTGVGNVETVMAVVAADLGVVRDAESGVNGVLARGESSGRAGRVGASTGVLPERRWLDDIWRVRRGAAAFEVGMTSGVRLLGERGCRIPSWDRCRSSLLREAGQCSNLSSVTWGLPEDMQSAR
jgi:hypothetical protein